MHDFGAFCYLDPQKTGSSFVSAFLDRHIARPAVTFRKHEVYAPRHGEDGKFFFISARDPHSWYRSLYAFGCEGKGGLFHAIKWRGLRRLYRGTSEGFAEWTEFMLDPRRAKVLKEGYPKVHADLFGFQTFRFLVLAFADPLRRLRSIDSRAALLEAWQTDRLPETVLKQESLNTQLAALIEHELRPYLADREAALASLASKKRVNPSIKLDVTLPPDVLGRLQEREWFMFDVLGYPKYV